MDMLGGDENKTIKGELEGTNEEKMQQMKNDEEIWTVSNLVVCPI